MPAALNVLLVTRNFPPLWGGMERLNWHLAGGLAKYGRVHVIGPSGARALAPEGVTVSEVPLSPLPRFLLMAMYTALGEARRFRPDVVLAGSGLTAPIALLTARSCDAFAAAYLHGLDLAVRHTLYRALWLPAVRRLDTVVANSHATASLARTVGVESTRIAIVPPGVEIPPERPQQRENMRMIFRQRYGLDDRPVLIAVGRLTQRKGVSAFVREVLPNILKAQPDTCLLVVGDAPKAALAAQPDPPEAILAEAEAVGVTKHVHCLGPLFGDDLKAAWYAADVHVFPVRQLPNDPEGFGMVAIEAAAHGVSTVAYATGGVSDAVSAASGRLIEPGNSQAFSQAVVAELMRDDKDRAREDCHGHACQFAWPLFGARLRDIFAGAPRSAE